VYERKGRYGNNKTEAKRRGRVGSREKGNENTDYGKSTPLKK